MKKIFKTLAVLTAFVCQAATETINGITWTYDVYDGNATVYYIPRSVSGRVAVPDFLGGYPVTGIDTYAFEWCTKITDVVIGANVSSIGAWAFHDGECNIRTFSVASGNIAYKVVDGYLMSTDGTVLVACPSSKSGVAVVPEGVKEIAATAFADCDNLTGVTLPESLERIGEYAFTDCGQLSNIVIPDAVTAVEQYAFSDCKRLRSVSVCETLEGAIDGTAFSDCELNPRISYRAAPRFLCHYTLVTGRVGRSLVNTDTAAPFVDIDFVDFDNADYDGEESSCTYAGIPAGLSFDKESEICVDDMPAYDSSVTWWYSRYDSYHPLVGTPTRTGTFKMTITAKWADGVTQKKTVVFEILPEELFIAFEGNGYDGAVDGMFVDKGKAIGELPLLERDKYVFLGWFTEPAGGRKITAATKPSTSCTYYAQWRFVGRADENTIYVNTDSSYNADDDGSFELSLAGETIESYSEPRITVKGLPAGIKYDAKKAMISGKCVKPGAYKVAVSVSNATVKKAVVREFELVVPNFESDVFPELVAATDFYNFKAGTLLGADWIHCRTSEPDWKVTVQGLPAGLKWDTKEGCIVGVPTKPGVYTVTFTAKKGKETEIATITLNIDDLPAVAYGSFSGFLTFGDDGAFNKVGSLQLTVTDVGKMSAKIVTAAGSFSFSGAGWTVRGDGRYRLILETRKREVLDLWLSPETPWYEDQITGSFFDAEGYEHIVSAQKTVFGQPWHFTAVGSADEGWRLVRTWDKKSADITVTVKDGATKLAGKIGGLSVNSSGFVNMSDFALGRMKASFTPVVTVNRVKKVLVVDALLSFDASVTDGGVAGFND